MLTWIYKFRPGNKNIHVVFDEESECSGPRTPTLSPDQVFLKEKLTPEKIRKTMRFLINILFLPPPPGRWTRFNASKASSCFWATHRVGSWTAAKGPGGCEIPSFQRSCKTRYHGVVRVTRLKKHRKA